MKSVWPVLMCIIPAGLKIRRFTNILYKDELSNLRFLLLLQLYEGTPVAQWLRYCATNRKVADSIPAGVSGFVIYIISFRSHYGPGVDSASNRNEYQEYFLGVKAAGT